jgi:hypothetical protein
MHLPRADITEPHSVHLIPGKAEEIPPANGMLVAK